MKVLVEADLRFTLSFNGIPPGVDPDAPCAGGGSLVNRPWPLSAVAAVSTLTTVTVTTGDRRWEQDLTGAEPVSVPRDCGACDETGTRVTFALAPDFFAAGTEIPRTAAELTADLEIMREIDQPAWDLMITDLRPTN